MKTVKIRFYEELNDFLPLGKKKKQFEHNFSGRVSIKDMIEGLGVPHTEIDLILINGKSVDFNYLAADGDQISVYPVFESFDIKDIQRLRPVPLREPKFVLDVHLGKLCKLMRILGLDVYYRNDLEDDEIIEISVNKVRTILTRDLGILKHKKVEHGCFVRNTKPEKQLLEIIERFQLKKEIKLFSRCLVCNNKLVEAGKDDVIDRIPPKVKEHYERFFICNECDKVYWRGSHFEEMIAKLKNYKII